MIEQEKILEGAVCLALSALIKAGNCDFRSLRRLVIDKSYTTLASTDNPVGRMLSGRRQWYLKRASQMLEKGIGAFTLADERYPLRLRQISGAPLVIYWRGRREVWQKPRAVAVIGSRNPTGYGRAVTRKITEQLIRPDLVVVSGLARGIDGLAHQIVRQNGGLALAVVAQGVDVAYPACHRELGEWIAKNGLIVSEHEPGTIPRRQYFPARNRILSGLADKVAVIEAAQKSGTLITAGFAADQGRDVWAVPGNILSPLSTGCNQLIRDGAGVLLEAQDLF